MTLSEYLIEYRTAHHLSQRQFALNCGLSNGYISMLEKNRNPKTGQPLTPTLPVLHKIAHGMGMSVHQLFEATDDISLDIFLPRDDKLAPRARGELDSLDWEIIDYLPDLTTEQKRFLLAQLKTFREQSQG